MQAPDFWWKTKSWQATALSPIAALYSAIATQRMQKMGKKVDIPVLCIGNFTAGGGGKTPTSIAIAKFLKHKNPAFLTRGYGRKSKEMMLVDLAVHTYHEVGDEPLLLAQHAPTLVTADRVKGAEFLQKQGAGIIIMDDGFQNPSLNKSFSLIVIDSTRGFGNRKCLPAGPLRAHLPKQIEKADAFLIMGNGDKKTALIDELTAMKKPCFTARVKPTIAIDTSKKYLAYTGIANPQKFFTSLKEVGAIISVTREFPDHHAFTNEESSALLEQAAANNLTLITTEKDAARLKGQRLKAASKILPITTHFDDEAGLLSQLNF